MDLQLCGLCLLAYMVSRAARFEPLRGLKAQQSPARALISHRLGAKTFGINLNKSK
uniref:Uncharacterized protein n=1 Tax=Picea glauca TaxID=3330 RepID=A0A101M418_PICGL|nr:hypothetical protein ABT39_MTgene330 [Picea glauca]QHR90669.1 hypothetical protein Q903MT_gene4694 [Picea sitchensis]